MVDEEEHDVAPQSEAFINLALFLMGLLYEFAPHDFVDYPSISANFMIYRFPISEYHDVRLLPFSARTFIIVPNTFVVGPFVVLEIFYRTI